jgi:hypothetical protein
MENYPISAFVFFLFAKSLRQLVKSLIFSMKYLIGKNNPAAQNNSASWIKLVLFMAFVRDALKSQSKAVFCSLTDFSQ